MSDRAHARRRHARATGAPSIAARRLALDPASRAAVDAGAPRRWPRIVAKGEPVYGINTGFGKLASVRIARRRTWRTLQRNIVLSHAAGVGEPLAGRRSCA